jgi:hypothetical protein
MMVLRRFAQPLLAGIICGTVVLWLAFVFAPQYTYRGNGFYSVPFLALPLVFT